MSAQSPITGIIIVDHGSRRRESNDMLLQAVESFKATAAYAIVEPAHMEIATPDIATAYDRFVEQGARRIVVFPYFLSPGRHWSEDIPALVAAAAERHPGTEWLVTAPFGLHSQMQQIIADRIESCLRTATAAAPGGCDVCRTGEHCRLHAAGAPRTAGGPP
jgi:sirohydrochlorin ferrochelatase